MTEIFTELAGLSFRPKTAKEVVDTLQIGDTLTLERDPENEYDDNAIKVLAVDEFIGFIPKVDNLLIAQHMDAGGEITCTVVSWLGNRKPGLKVTLNS
jgi:hypothetical protein